MPSQKNLTLARHIQSLEKNVLKLKQQLLKAHATKISKLEKQVQNTTTKLKKAKEKRQALKNKKTAAAQRQRQTVDLSISTLDADNKALKQELSQAKEVLKNIKEVEKASLKTKADIAKDKSKKTVLKKKAVKKALKKAKATKPLTPDLSKPVNNAGEDKPQKTWKPKTKVKKKKPNIEKPVVVPEKEAPAEQHAFPFPTVEASKPPTPTMPSIEKKETEDKISNKSNDQKKPVPEKASPSETPSEKVEKNWHTIPLLRPLDE